MAFSAPLLINISRKWFVRPICSSTCFTDHPPSMGLYSRNSSRLSNHASIESKVVLNNSRVSLITFNTSSIIRFSANSLPSLKRKAPVLSGGLHFFTIYLFDHTHVTYVTVFLIEYIRELHRSEERRVGKECRSRWS